MGSKERKRCTMRQKVRKEVYYETEKKTVYYGMERRKEVYYGMERREKEVYMRQKGQAWRQTMGQRRRKCIMGCTESMRVHNVGRRCIHIHSHCKNKLSCSCSLKFSSTQFTPLA